MDEQFERTKILIGKDGLNKLLNAKVLIVGVGGVGSFVAEFLARAGVGNITVIDNDVISSSNINRQLVALHSTIGQSKVDVIEKRIKDINPSCEVSKHNSFLNEINVDEILLEKKYNIVIDAIDSLNPKTTLLEKAYAHGIKIVSSMGAGSKKDPTKIEICDISKTKYCPLARRVRKKLRSNGINKGIKVVYSSELPAPHDGHEEVGQGKPRSINGTMPYLPAAFGIALSSEVLEIIINSTK
jgi:tRNA A37 threonylcarbamoyladenosine dehydratase